MKAELVEVVLTLERHSLWQPGGTRHDRSRSIGGHVPRELRARLAAVKEDIR